MASGWCASAGAQATFEPRMLDSNGSGAVAVADFNGDGRTDVACSSSDELSIHLCEGQGRFAPPIVLGLTALYGAGPTLVTGDVDNDGDEDLILGNVTASPQPTGELIVLLNNGSGVFVQGTSVSVPEGIVSLVAVDFDLNGTLDVFATNASTNHAIFLAGNGAGGWGGSGTWVTATIASSARAADFDGDGDLDLAILMRSGGLEIVINDGGFAFHWAAIYSDPYYSDDLAIEDFDGDGDLDVVYDRSNLGQLAIRRNDGAGNFGPPTTIVPPTNIMNIYELAAADLDHDGRADLLTSGKLGNYSSAISVARGLGGGAFAPFIANGLRSAHSLAIGDLNGDGELDVLSNNYYASGLDLMWGDGLGGLGPPRVEIEQPSNRIVRADFDADGRDDFVTVPYSGPTVTVALQSNAGVFVTSTLTFSSNVNTIAAGDFDADADIDLAACLSNQTLWTSLNDGAGHFGAPIASPMAVRAGVSAAADLNGDGLDDLAIGYSWYQDPYGFAVPAWYGCLISNGNGTFTWGPALPGANALTYHSLFEFVVGRFNADARDDFAIAMDSCVVIASSGATGFTAATIAPGPYHNTTTVASADLDGDGDLDLVFPGRFTGASSTSCFTALGNGQGAFTPLAPFVLPSLGVYRMSAGDFDGDGDLDVTYVDNASTVYLLVNNWPTFGIGTERFPTATSSTNGENGFAPSVGGTVALDANADGRTDLALTDTLVAHVRLLLQTKAWEHPDAYCTAKTTSNGCVPSIASTGVPSASLASGFAVTGTNVINQKNGLFFYSLNGRAHVPFQGGTLCVVSPVARTPLGNSAGNPAPDDCSGVFAIDMNAFAQGALGGSPQPALSVAGTVVAGQWWGRDPASSPGTMLSNAIEYFVGP